MRILRKETLLLLSLPLAVLSSPRTLPHSLAQPPEYDRLDGKGPSGKRVDVIEWEQNLEIHAYPVGSIHSLSLKLIENEQKKKIMVIGYRFNHQPQKELIRRAIVSVPLKQGFRAYRATDVDDFDKVIVSMNSLQGDVVAFRFNPQPSAEWPEGHPNRNSPENSAPTTRAVASPSHSPTSNSPGPSPGQTSQPHRGYTREGYVDENGSIQNYEW